MTCHVLHASQWEGPARVRFVFVLNPVAQELLQTLEPLVPEAAPSLRSQLRPLPEVLAGLLDLAGSVRLAERARATRERSDVSVDPSSVARVLEVEDEVRDRVGYLRRSALAKADSALAGAGDTLPDDGEIAALVSTVFAATKRQRGRRLAGMVAEIHSP